MKQPSGNTPRATSSTMVTTNDGRIIVFGGVFNGSACNDTYILNTGKRILEYQSNLFIGHSKLDYLVWVLAETTGIAPKPRCDHGCCVADKKMFVFGGSAGDSLWLNDLNYLDLGISCGCDLLITCLFSTRASDTCTCTFIHYMYISFTTYSVLYFIVYLATNFIPLLNDF